jgi:hypothetical protein
MLKVVWSPLEEERTIGRLSRILRISGYLVAGGALVGFSIGLYLILNREFFSFLVNIQTLEVMSYFLGVFMPSFVILIVIGYLLATTLGLKRLNLSNVAPLCVLSLLCMVLSSLSFFYFISFVGGLMTLTALVMAYTKPSFNILSKREAFFMVEIGALFVAASSALLLSLWLLSNVFQTYAMGFYASYSPYALLMFGIIGFLMFFLIPFWGSKGTNAGMCGVVGLVMTFLSYLFVVQNQYVLFNSPAYVSMFLLVLGLVLAVVGGLLYVRLFFSEPTELTVLTSPMLHHGKYCPYCGNPRVTASQSLCSYCGRSLLWTPYAPYCSSCGRLVPTDAHNCPHCREDIGDKRVIFQMQTATEQAIVSKVVKESAKEKSWIMKKLSKVTVILRTIGKGVWSVVGLVDTVINRLGLTFKETVVILILTYAFAFISFISHVSIVPARLGNWDMYILGYGLPLEWLQVFWLPRPMAYVRDVNVLWISLILDFMFYFLASLALVYGVARLRRLT